MLRTHACIPYTKQNGSFRFVSSFCSLVFPRIISRERGGRAESQPLVDNLEISSAIEICKGYGTECRHFVHFESFFSHHRPNPFTSTGCCVCVSLILLCFFHLLHLEIPLKFTFCSVSWSFVFCFYVSTFYLIGHFYHTMYIYIVIHSFCFAIHAKPRITPKNLLPFADRESNGDSRN